MTRFETPEGVAEFETLLCHLTSAKPGDILVIRYGGAAEKIDAMEFRDALMLASMGKLKDSVPNGLPVVITRMGVSWALEQKEPNGD